MTPHPDLDATTRVALAAYLHDIGKLAERAAVFKGDPRVDAHLTLYCPFHEPVKGQGWHSHRHAAHTAMAIDALEPFMPDLLQVSSVPFVSRRQVADALPEAAQAATDSLINAAAAHHKPDSFLQWIVATADRVASGFEREEFDKYNAAEEGAATKKNHFQARQLTLFEQIKLTPGDELGAMALKQRYPLSLMSPHSIFPCLAAGYEPDNNEDAQAEYAVLWRYLKEAIQHIPASHKASLPLWFDHFDSLWMTCTHAVPAATAFKVKPEVSLYDHSRTAAALAAALWRWHAHHGLCDVAAAQAMKTRSDFAERKFLLIQGDFFGIQEFVFATGGDTRKQAAKLLRGRSMQVSLFTELAALRILEALGLPQTSQVINAAGKFLIVAPNTTATLATLAAVKADFDEWFKAQTFGMAGVGVAWEKASCRDFLRGKGERDEKTPFSQLLERLRQSLERAKYQRFELARQGGEVFGASFPLGPCAWHGKLPADQAGCDDKPASCALSRDQIRIGEAIAQGLDRALILDEAARNDLRSGGTTRVLELSLFGYVLAFTRSEGLTGSFGQLAADGLLRRCWDFSAPRAADADGTAPLFAGYARRFISGYVPHVSAADLAQHERYLSDEELPGAGELKTFDMLACEDRTPTDNGGWQGVAALGVLKGDVDDLGEVFRLGLRQPSFAKWAALSRQVNGFFAIYLPWLLASEFKNVYTVFAGGDDFFLIGPWRSVQQLSSRMAMEFSRYCAGNPELHFSAGIATQKPGAPVQTLAELAECALHFAKTHEGKNAITCFGQTVRNTQWPALHAAGERLGQLQAELGLSIGYVYGLLSFTEMRQKELGGDATAAMWRARMAYRTRRMVQAQIKGADDAPRQRAQVALMHDIAVQGIEKMGGAYRIVLFNHLYQYRNR